MKRRAPKPKSARTERRENERAGVKLAKARLELAQLEAGGSPDRPIEVTSASVVEPHAAGIPCAVCDAPVRVLEHVAVSTPRALRVVRVRCTRCATPRELYFQLTAPLPN